MAQLRLDAASGFGQDFHIVAMRRFGRSDKLMREQCLIWSC